MAKPPSTHLPTPDDTQVPDPALARRGFPRSDPTGRGDSTLEGATTRLREAHRERLRLSGERKALEAQLQAKRAEAERAESLCLSLRDTLDQLLIEQAREDEP